MSATTDLIIRYQEANVVEKARLKEQYPGFFKKPRRCYWCSGTGKRYGGKICFSCEGKGHE